VTISSWLNFGRPAAPRRGSAAGRDFWLHLSTASSQCLRLSERFFINLCFWSSMKNATDCNWVLFHAHERGFVVHQWKGLLINLSSGKFSKMHMALRALHVSSGVDLVVKYGGGLGSLRSNYQTVSGASKISFTFHFRHKYFIVDDVNLAELSNKFLNERMWHFYFSLGMKTYSDGLTPYIFSGVRNPNSQYLRPARVIQQRFCENSPKMIARNNGHLISLQI